MILELVMEYERKEEKKECLYIFITITRKSYKIVFMNNDNQQQQKQNISKKKHKLNLVLTFCHISFMSADIKNYIFMIIIYLPIQDTIFLLFFRLLIKTVA